MTVNELKEKLLETIKKDDSRDDIKQFVCMVEEASWQVYVEADSKQQAVDTIVENLLKTEESARPFQLEV